MSFVSFNLHQCVVYYNHTELCLQNDAGLAMGVQDASIFNLDNKLSLSAFQTFLKTKLTCTVKVKAVPRSWRLKKDLYSFLIERLSPGRPDSCGQFSCVRDLDCSENYTITGRECLDRCIHFQNFIKLDSALRIVGIGCGWCQLCLPIRIICQSTSFTPKTFIIKSTNLQVLKLMITKR